MIHAIYAGLDKDQFQARTDKFQNQDINITQANSGAIAYTMMMDKAYDLLITEEHLRDMSGKALIEKAVAHNPFLNCVAVSNLSHEEFHEEYEGLGVIMQLPYDLKASDIKGLNDHLKKIANLFTKA